MHVVENNLRGVEVFVVAGYVVCCDPVDSIDVRGPFVRYLLTRFIFRKIFYLPSQNPPSLIIIVVVQKATRTTGWRHCHSLRERRRTSSGGSGGVERLRLVISLDDLLHLEVVFLGLGKSVFEDGKSLFLDFAVDGGKIGYHGETCGC